MQGDEEKRRTVWRNAGRVIRRLFPTAPIAREGGKADFIHASDSWVRMDIRVCYLDEQFRQKDSSLEKLLNEMRKGTLSSASKTD